MRPPRLSGSVRQSDHRCREEILVSRGLCLSASSLLIGLLACTDDVRPRVLVPCADPVSVPEAPDPPELGYIVGLLDGVDTSEEVSRLETSCGFQATTVFSSVFAFHAVLSQPALDCVRCDPVVESIVPNRPMFLTRRSTEPGQGVDNACLTTD